VDQTSREIPVELEAALADRYTMRRVLGRGGMATVYLADDKKHTRAVALKVLLPGLAAYLGVERFLKEIQIAARLTHPHILALYDSGEAGGFLYYVMPYIDGASLRLGGGGMGPIIGVGVGALHLVGAAVLTIIPAWLGITYLTARTVYRRATTKRAHELESLTNRLEALARELVEFPQRLKP